jgi:enterochelin esterase-like enzyme/outer membrane protein assembly factor BamB
VTAFSEGDSDFVAALDAGSGEELWRYRIGELYEGHEGSDDGPLATPAIHDGTVFGLGPRGKLFALRLAGGGEIWSLRIAEAVGAREPLYGFTSAPTIISGVLVLQTGGDEGRAISGFDPATGKLLWSSGEDDVSYQSPAMLRVGEEEQIFAVTNRLVLGLAPRTGEILWSHEHTPANSGGFGNAQALPVGEASALLRGRNESALFHVEKKENGYRVEEVWRSRGMYGGLVTPVPHGGYLYGYAGRQFLTCVDATSGETVWKSRQPGVGNLVLVDGHLVILASNGDVVVAEATAEGYREKARVKALDRGYLTWPSFADGRVYVRNLTEIAGVAVTDEASPPIAREGGVEADVDLAGRLKEFVRAVESTQDKGPVIDEFLANSGELPMLEGEELVHFVFRGEVDDLMLVGDMRLNHELPLHRIAETDVYVRSMRLEPAARFEYGFAVFDETRLDPRNPRTSVIDGRERSVLTTHGWKKPGHLEEPKGPRGRIETFQWQSELLENKREVRVYLPPGYDDGDRRYPLLVVAEGDEALEWGLMDRSLDNLVGRSVEPLIVAFVPLVHFTELGSLASDYGNALATELVPRIDGTYRTRARREARGIFGTRWAGAQSIYVALKRPELFGKVAAQSLEAGVQRDGLLDLARAEGENDLQIYLEWSVNGYEPVRAFGEELVTALEEGGYSPIRSEVADGIGWGGWRQHTDRVLETLFPLE